jgi:preprotein translocase subunit YajC
MPTISEEIKVGDYVKTYAGFVYKVLNIESENSIGVLRINSGLRCIIYKDAVQSIINKGV